MHYLCFHLIFVLWFRWMVADLRRQISTICTDA
jgi:hypothetical protein